MQPNIIPMPAVQMIVDSVLPVQGCVHGQIFSNRNVKADTKKAPAFTLTKKIGGKMAVFDMRNPAAML